jgi:hypothetical protein
MDTGPGLHGITGASAIGGGEGVIGRACDGVALGSARLVSPPVHPDVPASASTTTTRKARLAVTTMRRSISQFGSPGSRIARVRCGRQPVLRAA